MACEFEPPIEIIQHIQSFLTGKEAAQTCILSKSWFTAWSTRPILYLDESDFIRWSENDCVPYEFPMFSRKTVQKYKELDMRPEKFVLRMRFYGLVNCCALADELIADALELGVSELELELNCSTNIYVLPAHEFAARSLTRLNICYGEISQPVLCSRLTSLSLKHVYVTDNVVRDVLLGCPLIENLDLSYCYGLENVKVSKMLNLVKFCVNDSIRVEFEDVIDGLASYVPEFRYLCQLKLKRVKVSDEFFTNFSSRFPCLVDLEIRDLSGCKNPEISSHSLRYISLYELKNELENLWFDVPNISRFVLKESYHIPLLSFIDASEEWKSDIELEYLDYHIIGASWFVKLRVLLNQLRLSRISLSIKFWKECLISIKGMVNARFPLPAVENLMVCTNLSETAMRKLLSGLFKSCRPNFITECKCTWHSHDNGFLKFMYKILIQYDNKDLLCTYDLKEVNVEQFEQNVMQWQSIPVAKGEDSPAILRDDEQIRFRFNWE